MNWKKIIKPALLIPITIILVFVVIASCYIAYLFIPQRMRIVTADKSVVKEVPYYIALTQNCQAYNEWLVGNIPPLLWPNGGGCPWGSKPKGEIGEFIINGVKLYLSRSYLLFNTNIQDGKVASLSLLMQYPTMKPATGMYGEEGRDYNIMVTIDEMIDGNRKPFDAELSFYLLNSGIKQNKNEKKENYIKKITESKSLNLTKYEFNKSIGSHFYIDGSPLKPRYWLMCDTGEYEVNIPPYPHCQSWFNYNDKIYVSYFFAKWVLLDKHEDLRRRIITKINEFKKLK